MFITNNYKQYVEQTQHYYVKQIKVMKIYMQTQITDAQTHTHMFTVICLFHINVYTHTHTHTHTHRL